MNALQPIPQTPLPEPSSQERRVTRGKELRVVVIREEFIALTGEPLIAALLNQLVYWSQRVSDFDLFLAEERVISPKCRSTLKHGWFYKTSLELIEETMLCVTPATLRRYLNYLEGSGWIETRKNPKNKWDRTAQYRVNLRKLSYDLQRRGYPLLHFLKQEVLPQAQNEGFEEAAIETATPAENPEISPEVKNESSNMHNVCFEAQKSFTSNEKKITSRMEQNKSCNTETTTEITNKEHAQRTQAGVREDFQSFGFSEKSQRESLHQSMVNIWQRQIRNDKLHLTKKRSHLLASTLQLYFGNNLAKWEDCCLRIKASSFLMGGGPRKWKTTLDWILEEANLVKVLEGNFDDAEMAGVFSDKSVFHAERTQKIQAILDSIKDPVWREWCTRLSQGVPLHKGRMLQEPLSLAELTQIANARFVECEEDRLIWIGSSDPDVLKAIESLRFKLTWVFAKQYPKARTIRTRLETLGPPVCNSNTSHHPLEPLSSKHHTHTKTGEIYA